MRPRTLARYADVDWSRTDPAIAADLHVTKQAVSLVRHKLGKPPTRGNNNGFTAAARAGLVDWSLGNAELARLWKVSPLTPGRVRRSVGAPPAPVRPRGSDFLAAARAGRVDWSRSDAELARAWKVSRHTTWATRRALGVGPAKK